MNGHRRSKALRAAFLVNNEGTVVYNNVNFKARGSSHRNPEQLICNRFIKLITVSRRVILKMTK